MLEFVDGEFLSNSHGVEIIHLEVYEVVQGQVVLRQWGVGEAALRLHALLHQKALINTHLAGPIGPNGIVEWKRIIARILHDLIPSHSDDITRINPVWIRDVRIQSPHRRPHSRVSEIVVTQLPQGVALLDFNQSRDIILLCLAIHHDDALTDGRLHEKEQQ